MRRDAAARPRSNGRGAGWKRLLDWIVVAAGLVMLWWGIFGMAAPTLTCRGQVMGPGDVCHKSSYTAVHTDTVQTYDQRRRAVSQSRPTVIALGAVTLAFGAGMAISRSRPRRTGSR